MIPWGNTYIYKLTQILGWNTWSKYQNFNNIWQKYKYWVRIWAKNTPLPEYYKNNTSQPVEFQGPSLTEDYHCDTLFASLLDSDKNNNIHSCVWEDAQASTTFNKNTNIW